MNANKVLPHRNLAVDSNLKCQAGTGTRRRRVCFWDTRFWAGHFAALSTPTLLRRAYAWEATFPTCMGSHSLWNTSVQFTVVHHCILFASSGTKCRYLCFEPHICQVVFQETSMEYVCYTGILNVTAQRKQSELFLQLIGRISFQ